MVIQMRPYVPSCFPAGKLTWSDQYDSYSSTLAGPAVGTTTEHLRHLLPMSSMNINISIIFLIVLDKIKQQGKYAQPLIK
jgi:hypothetical protein